MTIDPRDEIRPLSSETNSLGQPWRCATLYEHECDGVTVGAVGPIPICAAGAAVERASRVQDRERIRRFEIENADLLRREAEAENAYERMANGY